MSVVSMSISKKGERRSYLSLEIRMQIYNDVIELRKQGLSYGQIQRKIYEKYRKRISRSRISNWISGKQNPLKIVNKFDGKPSLELSYIIGAILSDGCRYFNKNNRKYSLILGANDKEFTEEFGKCLAKVLGRKEPYKPYWDKNKEQWVVEVCSVLLYKFLDKPLKELKMYIEYSKETTSAFLKALFDGEGCIWKRILKLFNTNRKLLVYSEYLLKRYFNINTTGLHLAQKKGKYKSTKNYYYIYIRANSLSNFHRYIGFSIKRKQQRLIEAIR